MPSETFDSPSRYFARTDRLPLGFRIFVKLPFDMNFKLFRAFYLFFSFNFVACSMTFVSQRFLSNCFVPTRYHHTVRKIITNSKQHRTNNLPVPAFPLLLLLSSWQVQERLRHHGLTESHVNSEVKTVKPKRCVHQYFQTLATDENEKAEEGGGGGVSKKESMASIYGWGCFSGYWDFPTLRGTSLFVFTCRVTLALSVCAHLSCS